MTDRKYQLKVEVQPRYLADQSKPENGQFAFAYTVRITNAGSVPSQVISRHWIITDAHGKVVEVKGLGVVGQQPLIPPGQTFEYTSGSQIATPAGTMRGSYFCVAEDGERFEAPVPEWEGHDLGVTQAKALITKSKEIVPPDAAAAGPQTITQVHIIRHGETQGYSTESGLTPLLLQSTGEVYGDR